MTYASGAVIPPGGCTIEVDVTSAVPGGPYVNTVPAGALQTDLGNNDALAAANLLVNPAQPPSISKGFAPVIIGAGGTSTLTIAYGNGNAGDPTSDLVDTLPAGITVADPPNVRVAGGCSLELVDAPARGGTIADQTGAVIPPGGCSIAVDVTAAGIGSFTNSIPAGALQTDIGSNLVGTQAGIESVAPSAISGTVLQ